MIAKRHAEKTNPIPMTASTTVTVKFLGMHTSGRNRTPLGRIKALIVNFQLVDQA